MPIDALSQNLNHLSSYLEGLEEKIIFNLLNRAQYKLNLTVYKPGKSGFKDHEGRSLFEIRLLMQEQLDAKFGRFTVPEERPFHKNLPPNERTFDGSQNTHLYVENFDLVNLTEEIKQFYLSFLPNLCTQGDDGHHGSSVEYDVYSLQAISERVHFGSFYVAEKKYQLEPETYQKLISQEDRDGLLMKLTRKQVEEKILDRVREKIMQYQSGAVVPTRHLVEPGVIVKFYSAFIIPLTKKGQILYLLSRRI